MDLEGIVCKRKDSPYKVTSICSSASVSAAMPRKIRVLIEAEMTYIRTLIGEIDYQNSPNLNATHLLRWVCPSCIYIRRSCSQRYSRSTLSGTGCALVHRAQRPDISGQSMQPESYRFQLLCDL